MRFSPAPGVGDRGHLFCILRLPSCSLNRWGGRIPEQSGGEHRVQIAWWDRCGHGGQTLTLVGADGPGAETPPDLLDVVNGQVMGHFADTTWATHSTTLHTVVQAENTGETPLVGPLYLAIGPRLHPACIPCPTHPPSHPDPPLPRGVASGSSSSD